MVNAGRRDVLGKQYEFACRPEWKPFERARHVTDIIETCVRAALSNDHKSVILQAPPCHQFLAKVRLSSVLAFVYFSFSFNRGSF